MLKSVVMENLYYRFRSVSVEQFATLSDSLSENDTMDYETTFSFRFIKDERLLISRSEVNLLQNKELKMKSVLDCTFEVKEESVIDVTQEDGSIVFPRNLLIQLASLNYGTLRGIVIERTKGTVFSSIILPPLVVGDIIKEDLVIRFDAEVCDEQTSEE
jgi:hypothetical protein